MGVYYAALPTAWSKVKLGSERATTGSHNWVRNRVAGKLQSDGRTRGRKQLNQ